MELKCNNPKVVNPPNKVGFEVINNNSTCFYIDNYGVYVNNNVKRVRVTFVAGGISKATQKRIWARINHRRAGTVINSNDAIQYGDYCSPCVVLIVDVQSGDDISFYVNESAELSSAGTKCYAYVEKVA